MCPSDTDIDGDVRCILRQNHLRLILLREGSIQLSPVRACATRGRTTRQGGWNYRPSFGASCARSRQPAPGDQTPEAVRCSASAASHRHHRKPARCAAVCRRKHKRPQPAASMRRGCDSSGLRGRSAAAWAPGGGFGRGDECVVATAALPSAFAERRRVGGGVRGRDDRAGCCRYAVGPGSEVLLAAQVLWRGGTD